MNIDSIKEYQAMVICEKAGIIPPLHEDSPERAMARIMVCIKYNDIMRVSARLLNEQERV